MKLRDLRIGWRTLIQEPAYTLASVLGLGVGLAACLLLLGYVRYSMEYDTHLPDADQVYVVKHHFNVEQSSPLFDLAPMFLRETALKIPGVVDATSYIPARPEITPLTVRVDRNLMTVRGLIVLPGFPSMLGLRAVQGDLAQALERPDLFVITETAALRLFGTRNALGRTMLSEGATMQVGAIVPAPPANTTIPFEVLFGVHAGVVEKVIRHEMLTGESGWMTKMLLRVKPGSSVPGIVSRLQHAVDVAPSMNHWPPEVRERLGKRKPIELSMSPLRDAYFDHTVRNSFIALPGDRASPVATAGLALMAVLILLLAGINYVNLAMVRVLRRQREVAMRKVLGAGAPRIALQFVLESLLVTMVATVLALLLAWLALPAFSQLVNRQLDGLFSLQNVAAAFGIGGLLGLATAAYPVWIALRVPPRQALEGRPDTESMGSMQWRRALTVLQAADDTGHRGARLHAQQHLGHPAAFAGQHLVPYDFFHHARVDAKQHLERNRRIGRRRRHDGSDLHGRAFGQHGPSQRVARAEQAQRRRFGDDKQVGPLQGLRQIALHRPQAQHRRETGQHDQAAHRHQVAGDAHRQRRDFRSRRNVVGCVDDAGDLERGLAQEHRRQIE